MHATDLDKDIDCPACGGTGASLETDTRNACPACEGSGAFNRYQDADENEVIVGPVNYYQRGPAIVVEKKARMPVEDDEIGGFNGRFGTFEPSNPVPDFPQDLLDQTKNQPLGTNTDADGTYSVNGTTFDASTLPGGSWPSDGGLNIDQVIGWQKGRGDVFAAQVFQNLKDELGL